MPTQRFVSGEHTDGGKPRRSGGSTFRIFGEHRVAAWFVRVTRLMVLLAAAWLIHRAADRAELVHHEPLATLSEARRLFPQAARFGARDLRLHAQLVLDARGQSLGMILKTSPQADDILGYSGPSNLLVGIGPDGRLVGVELLWSKDTPAHVEEVRRAKGFWEQFRGWKVGASTPPPIDAVTGSTLTSLALVEAIQRRLGGAPLSLRFPSAVSLEEARELFPTAALLREHVPRPGWLEVVDQHHAVLGYLLRSSPEADNVRGYRGPTDALIALAPDRQTVVAVRLRASYDTPEYVERVRDDHDFLRSLAQRSVQQWAEIDYAAEGIEGVSGATQTSFAFVEGIRRRLQAERAAAHETASQGWRWSLRDTGLLLVLVGAVVMGYTHLKAQPSVRRLWQGLLMVGFGLCLGDLLSLALLAGWARHGVPWHTAPLLVALAALALLAPWTTRRQIYCHHVCPHGAAQEWLGRFRGWHRPVPPRVSRVLSGIPGVLLGVAFLLAVLRPDLDLAPLEPFDGWVLKTAAPVSLTLAVIGLLTSLFVPMAYCRFGCPTGALLKFVRSHGRNEHFRGADAWACLLVLTAAGWLYAPREIFTGSATPQTAVWKLESPWGTWTVRARSRAHPAEDCPERLTTLLAEVDTQFSSQREESETYQFNTSDSLLEMEFSPALIALVEFGRTLQRATEGAFSLFSLPQPQAEQRGDFERWLRVSVQDQTLQKTIPELRMNLDELLPGYAVDRAAALLDEVGLEDYLIETADVWRARGRWRVSLPTAGTPTSAVPAVWLDQASLALQRFSQPSGHVGLCVVVAPTAQEARGWAAALTALKPEHALMVAEQHDLAILIIDARGTVARASKFPVTWLENP